MGKPSLESLLEDASFKQTVRNLAYGFYRPYGYCPMVTMEDLINEGNLAASLAYGNFDISRGCTFKTHAFPYMRYAMNTYCRRYSHVLSISEKETRSRMDDLREIGVMRIDQYNQDDEDHDFDIPQTSGMDMGFDFDEYYFAGFSHFEKALAIDYFIEEVSLQELSARHGVSKSRAGSIIQELKHRMKSRVQKNDEEN